MQWRYYFYLSRVRILVSPWLLTWFANYKRASRSGTRPVLLKFCSQNGFEVPGRYSYSCFFFISCVFCRNFISIYKINRTSHGRLGIQILSSCAEKYLFLVCFTHSWEMLSALEDKIRIPARPCNILYLLNPLNLNSKKSIKLISIPNTNKL